MHVQSQLLSELTITQFVSRWLIVFVWSVDCTLVLFVVTSLDAAARDESAFLFANTVESRVMAGNPIENSPRLRLNTTLSRRRSDKRNGGQIESREKTKRVARREKRWASIKYIYFLDIYTYTYIHRNSRLDNIAVSGTITGESLLPPLSLFPLLSFPIQLLLLCLLLQCVLHPVRSKVWNKLSLSVF